MKSYVFPCCFLLLSIASFSQQINGIDLLDKAIQYHDPYNNWETFNGAFNVTMETPNSAKRHSKIKISLPKEYFNLVSKKDSGEYILLTEEETINNIKMPKNRAWYYNKNDGYLGTDILKK